MHIKNILNAFFLMTLFFLFIDSAVASELSLETDYTRIVFSDYSEIGVEKTLSEAVLLFSVSSKDRADAQSKVNKRMKTIVSDLKEKSELSVSTGYYSVYQDSVAKKWVATQQLVLNSRNKEALLRLVGELQSEGLVLQSLTKSLPEAERSQYIDALTTDVLKKLKIKAELIAKELSKSTIHFSQIELNSQSQGAHFRQLSSTKEMSDAPVLESEPERIRVDVQAQVLLK
jgi:predicted secreted protein